MEYYAIEIKVLCRSEAEAEAVQGNMDNITRSLARRGKHLKADDILTTIPVFEQHQDVILPIFQGFINGNVDAMSIGKAAIRLNSAFKKK